MLVYFTIYLVIGAAIAGLVPRLQIESDQWSPKNKRSRPGWKMWDVYLFVALAWPIYLLGAACALIAALSTRHAEHG